MSLPDEVAFPIASGEFPSSGAYFMALYTTALNGSTAQAYDPAGEVPPGDYPTKGFAMAAGDFTPDFWRFIVSAAVYDPADVQSAPASTFSFRSLLVYNDTPTTPRADPGLYFFDTGATQVVTNGQLTVTWPIPDQVTGLVRLPQ